MSWLKNLIVIAYCPTRTRYPIEKRRVSRGCFCRTQQIFTPKGISIRASRAKEAQDALLDDRIGLLIPGPRVVPHSRWAGRDVSRGHFCRNQKIFPRQRSSRYVRPVPKRHGTPYSMTGVVLRLFGFIMMKSN